MTALHSVEQRSQFGMIVTGTTDASRVGADILERGGNAIDASVAAALVLAVVDPGDSGLGGMTLATVRLADGRSLAVDGASAVPMRFDRDLINRLQDEGVKTSIEYVAVPASLAALAHMSQRYGTMPLDELITPAIEIAENGFTLSSFQIYAIEKYVDRMLDSQYLRFEILDNGTDLPKLGNRYYRPKIKRVLEAIAQRGPNEFFRGSIASQIHVDMQQRGGFVTAADLGLVRSREMAPVRGTYRGFEVLSYPSPGGGETVVHALNMLEQFPPELLAEHSLDRLQLLLDVFRISRWDGKQNRPDPNLPMQYRDLAFLDKEFAAARASLVQLGTAPPDDAMPPPSKCRDLENQTTHISVMDRWGNTVSMTQTLGNFYGAQRMHPELGIPYNNLLAGACEPIPRKFILCDMAPTIVTKDGLPVLALGSAGSSRIPAIVAFVISQVIDRGAGLGEAIDAPRALWGGRDYDANIEIFGPVTAEDVDALAEMGYQNMRLASLPGPREELTIFGGVNAVHCDGPTGMLTGVGDARRLGVAQGARF
jgi:gamma-glutamyltranspeptidase/glutathione hydrolase